MKSMLLAVVVLLPCARAYAVNQRVIEAVVKPATPIAAVALPAPAAGLQPAAAPLAPEQAAAAATPAAAALAPVVEAVNAAARTLGEPGSAAGDARGAGLAIEAAMTGERQPATLEEEIKARSGFVARYREQFGKAIVGQTEMRDSLLIGLLAGGHVLLEGVPGLAKTRAVKALAAMVDLQAGRIQFTRDLMPADITGQEEQDRKSGEWVIRKGPIFVDLLLADEINRAKAQTQSGMLQGMEERFVTIAGVSYPLSDLFYVIATQNPIEQDGVYPLPEAQMDRFMMKVDLPNPSAEELSRIAALKYEEAAAPALERVITRADVAAIRALVRRVEVSKDIFGYIGRLVAATHPAASSVSAVKSYVRQGASPRAVEWLMRGAQVEAFLMGRSYVVPDDVKAVAHRVLRHRIALSFEGQEKTKVDSVIASLLDGVPAVVK